MAALLKLPDYLARVQGMKWNPGALDCGIFMADWVLERRGVDPIADVRGSYSTERQFMRIVRREGGLVASCAARLAKVGATETSAPKEGDVIAVLAPYAVRRGEIQRRPTGALCVGRQIHAVVTSDMGLVIAGIDRLPLIRAWTFA